MKRTTAGGLSFFLALTAFLSFPVFVENGDTRTGRVGYVNVLNYEESGEEEYKSGAGYEHLQRISYLMGWNYEYVYDFFSKCRAMPANGEIDRVGNVSYARERAEQFDFFSYLQERIPIDCMWKRTTPSWRVGRSKN